MVDHLRQTAATPITLWKFRPDDIIIFATSSDAGGVAANDADEAQLAWQVCAADRVLASGSRARVSPLAWRSHRAKRAAPSTMAGE
eukprot:4193521-Pyramimonas_sp.AAC.1